MLIKEIPRVNSNTKNLATYIFNREKCTAIGGNIPIDVNDLRQSAHDIQNDFNSRLTAKQKSNEMHYVISFEESHSEISDVKLKAIAELLVKNHFGSNRNYAYAIHRDTKNPHIHLLMENRDFDSKPFYKKNNYREIENLAQKIEEKYGLQNKKIKQSREDKNRINLTAGARKYEHHSGKQSDEAKYKNELKSLLEKSKTAHQFFDLMKQNGYTINLNNSKKDPAKVSGYYITKATTSIKPSSVGLQISKLLQHFKIDDEGRLVEIMRNHEDAPPRPETAEPCGFGAISPERNFDKPNKKKLLYQKFDSHDGKTFISNNPKFKSSFVISDNSCSFQNPTEMSIKAGFQALQEKNGGTRYDLFGDDAFKRKAWLVGSLMGLEIEGYTPTAHDLKELLERYALHPERYKGFSPEPFQAQLEMRKKPKPPVIEATAPAEPVQLESPPNVPADNNPAKKEEEKKRRNLHKYK
ncbi:relaxase/mobilization nuclease domain-containing protein [Pseudomonas helleri]|uniref:Relaxase/mobilization nuclease domain-containing protein n=1 Tax=Pseudomonas cremoris TaxID=2724178 RepID=A0A7X1ANH0_9PSED|nr:MULTISPECIES: relaxase/mobilization nuclease domain-containing protein [Pseudomonas]MBC2407615.1 relaxase/mobilization nuclease domain-containing protein [Pseudomonas cremoris]MQU59600.1 relaxase/mobilization nuclease domain-containing protein [Pseudomonas helleri]